MSPSEFLKFIETPTYEADLKEWGEKSGLFDLNDRAEMFQSYLDAHSVIPKYWEERETGTSGAHWAQCVEVTLRSKLGWTTADLENKSLSEAFSDYFKHAENEGAIKLMTAEEIEFIARNKEVPSGT